MSAGPGVINPQSVAQCWKGVHLVRKDDSKGPLPAKLLSGDASSSSDELNTKVRKPYTITKQREKWTENEHQKFLEALKLYGRAWRRIEEHIGTKTAVQIRSHAQKFFTKLEREASTGSSDGKLLDIAIPPPRPKRKPNHPYPKKAGTSPLVFEDESKETLLSSAAGMAAACSEDFQSGSFNPCMTRGPAAPVAASSGAGGHYFGSQGVKIFGKTVPVPITRKIGFHGCASIDGLIGEDYGIPASQSFTAEPRQIVGFSPFVKVRKSVDASPKAHLHADRNGSATLSESIAKSLGRACGYDLAGYDTEAADSISFSDGDCKIRGNAGLAKPESSLSVAGQREGEKVDIQLSHPPSSALHGWKNNFINHPSGVSIPSIPASGPVDGTSNNSLSYWQFMQVSAVSYAAYTAAMAAAAAAGWKASNPGGADLAEAAKYSTSESHLSSKHLLQSPWWPCLGFIPPVYFPLPTDARQEGDAAETAKAVGSEQNSGIFQESPPQVGEPDTGFIATKLEGPCEPALNADGKTDDSIKNHTKTNSFIPVGSRLELSCITEAFGCTNVFPDSDSQLDTKAASMSAKLCVQDSDTEMRRSPILLRNAYSSSDEFEELGKKQGEGSSSGSNTPGLRFQPSNKRNAPTTMESKKRDCCTLSGDNNDSWSEAFQTPHQQCVTPSIDNSKQKLKHSEKGSKNQQKDSRYGDDSKRFKSCVHEVEARKEVSQEGRKAFQALFTSKMLPQTFPSERNFVGKDEHVSRPTVSKDDSCLIECINLRVVPEANRNRLVDNANNAAAAAKLKMGSEFQGLDGQLVASGTGFTVSSSSGFVPYRRLIITGPEPVKLDELSSLRKFGESLIGASKLAIQ